MYLVKGVDDWIIGLGLIVFDPAQLPITTFVSWYWDLSHDLGALCSFSSDWSNPDFVDWRPATAVFWLGRLEGGWGLVGGWLMTG